MNFETSTWRRDAIEAETVVIDGNAKKRRIIIGAVIALLAILGAVFFFSRGEEAATAPAGAAKAQSLPTVTVVVPGRSQVARTISANGTLAARRDMPVGVSGEGGLVTRVLVEPGQWVGAGQVLATVDRAVQTQQVNQMQANMGVMRADLALAQSELDRARSLVGRGFISKAEIDRKVAARDAAAARLRLGQAQSGEMRARLGRLDIRAPAAGLVLQRMVEPGQVVSSGSGALFRVAMGGEVEMLARMSQEDLAAVRVGVPASVTPVGATQSFNGQVWQVSPIIDPQTRQGVARIAVPYDPALRPGAFATATLTSGQTEAPLLPESAVQSDAKGSYVYIVNGNGVVVRRDVKVGSVTDGGVVIASGLAGNEQVVQSAGAFLNPGDKVNPTRAAARG